MNQRDLFRRRRPWLLGGSCLFGLVTLGCSWERFEQFQKNAPIQPLTPPPKTASFGQAVAGVSDGKRSFALGLGRQLGGPGASYILGIEEEPEIAPERSDYCSNAPPTHFCSPAATPVGLAVGFSGATPHKACFAYGSGIYEGNEGILSLCADRIVIVYPLPLDLKDPLVTPTRSQEETQTLHLASARGNTPHLLAGVPESARAFFYRPGDSAPVDLTVDPAAHPSFGAAVAVLSDPSGTVVFAVSAPDSGELWFFRDAAGTGLEPLGCQTLAPGDAGALSAGDIDGDGTDDLAFTSGSTVKALTGAPLLTLPADTSGVCGDSISSVATEIYSVKCQESEQVKGCGDADFGSALSLFDTDGDGKKELAVGGPGFTVNGKKQAGALLVYTSAGKFSDVIYRGDGAEKARFGESLAPVAQKDRDVLVVGEPGSDSMSIAYCAGLRSGDGSTRCATRASE